MPISRKSELRDFLSDLNTFPKKRLSQNFLVDNNIVEKIVKEASLCDNESVLEIGSGPGALTEALLRTGAHVTAVEKDPLLAEKLKRFEKLEVFSGDIRDFPFDTLKKKSKVVSNLPYHLTSPILALLLPRFDLFSELILMVQEEVAQRMVAMRGENFSAFTLFVKFFSEPKIAFRVSPNCFYPVPKVTSAVVRLKLIDRNPPFSCEGFFRLVKRAFQMRRKQLASSLREAFDPEVVRGALGIVGASPQARPEELNIEQWLEFYSALPKEK